MASQSQMTAMDQIKSPICRRRDWLQEEMGCLFIDSAVPNNDAESITDWGRICSHCVHGVHFFQNEYPFLWPLSS